MSYDGYNIQPECEIGDSIQLVAYLYTNSQQTDDQTLVPVNQISAAEFKIQRPQDAQGTYYTASADTITTGTATLIVPGSEHDTAGQYVGICTFTWGTTSPFNQQTTSYRVAYNVNDPFEAAGAQPYDPSVEDAWNRLDDLFDSNEGGAWLKEITRGRFDKTRIRQFIGQVFFDINETPPLGSSYDPTSFNYAQWDGQALVSQGLLVHTIRHLIRSYVEQPTVANSPVGYFDRRDYTQRWTAVYELEKQLYDRMLAFYKMHVFDSQQSKLLVSSKAGRNMVGALRQRGVWRGIY